LHGIATSHVERGHANPIENNAMIWRMFKGIKRAQGENVTKQRLPITVSILAHINHLFDENKLSDLCMRAAMWLGTCGLLRAGEFVTKPATKQTLQLRHLSFHNAKRDTLDPLKLQGVIPTYMKVRIEQSKTDPFRKGVDVVVANPRAIQYMLAYLQKRNQFLGKLPLFISDNGQPLTAASLVQFTQQLIQAANIPNAHLFLGHSFRKGGATSLHEAGFPDSLIKIMGRWASFAFATYIETPLYKIIDAGRALTKVEHRGVLIHDNAVWDVSKLQ
jgi:hypothetical protein